MPHRRRWPHEPFGQTLPRIRIARRVLVAGCAFWRYRLPLNKLKKLGTYLDINIADNPNKLIRSEDIQQHVKSADVISLQAPGSRDAQTLMRMYKLESKKVIVDYDDYSFDLSPGNPRYSELGTRECELKDDKGNIVYRWRDNENGFDLKANLEKYNAFVACVKMADLVTTTTEYLANKFRAHNPNVAICPNSVDFDLWRPIPRPAALQDQIRIGWFGGDSHYVDLKMFKNVLPNIAKRYKNVKMVIQGPPCPEWGDFFKDIPPTQLEWHGWTDLRYYPLFLASRHFDIGLCPLDDNDFNRCKSSIKQFEFSALGAAVVAQNQLPYSETIEHGKTGFLARTEDEWFEQISRLVEDHKLRNTIAMNGYREVRGKWNLEFNCRAWEKAYTELLERRAVAA